MESLEQKIVELYTRSGFGKALKSEIDALVFHHLLVTKLPEIDGGVIENGAVSYYRIDKGHIRALSLALRTTEAAVTRFLENDYLLHSAETRGAEAVPAAGALLELLPPGGLRKENIKDGKLRFMVANPIVRKILETELFKTGGIVDYSFNRDIIAIELYDFLRLCGFSDDAAVQEQIKAAVRERCGAKGLSGEEQQFIAELYQKPVSEQIKSVLKGGVTAIAKKILGEEGGGDAVGLVTRVINIAKEKAKRGKK